MSQNDFPADLLEPSLSEKDDIAGATRPWNPHSLILVMIFGGPLAGGFLYALNFKRLGQPSRFRPTLLAALAVFFAVLAPAVWHATRARDARERGIPVSASAEPDRELTAEEETERSALQKERNVIRGSTHLAAAGFAVVLMFLQRRRYQMHEALGGSTAGAFVPGVLAVIIGAVISLTVIIGLSSVLVR